MLGCYVVPQGIGAWTVGTGVGDVEMRVLIPRFVIGTRVWAVVDGVCVTFVDEG